MAKSQSKKSKKAPQKEVTVVHFVDVINFYDAADIICEKVNKMAISSKEMAFVAAEGGFDAQAFAQVLEDQIDPNMLQELLATEFGQGILCGIYMAHVGEQSLAQEVAALEAEEDSL